MIGPFALDKRTPSDKGQIGYQRIIRGLSTLSIARKVCKSRFDAIERRSGHDEQNSAVPTTKDEAGGALRNFNGVDVFAGGIKNEDLAGGNIHIAMRIYGNVLAALLGKQSRLGERPVGTNRYWRIENNRRYSLSEVAL